jgi:hypothetical protein
MVANLAGRIGKLEASAVSGNDEPRKVLCLVVREGEEVAAYSQAEEMGLDTSPNSNDLLIIRLLTCVPRHGRVAKPF